MSYSLCGNPSCNRLGTIKISDKKNNHLSGHLLLSFASSLTQVQSYVPSLWSSDTPTSFQTEGPCTSPPICLKLFLPSLFNAQVSLSFESWLICFLLRECFPSFHIPHPLSLFQLLISLTAGVTTCNGFIIGPVTWCGAASDPWIASSRGQQLCPGIPVSITVPSREPNTQ